MIVCNNINKKYNKCILFENFSYTFNDNGLYVLYGISGSGKTTLLQILLGITSFDNGEVIYDNHSYHKSVNYEEIQDKIAYISQDTYFIDYLTMEENLILQSKKSKDEIRKLVEKFNLIDCLNKLPNKLSGGERQRFALIGNILKNKRIFLLDEPTASLDKKNRDIFYEMLKELKEKALVICASHDNSILSLDCEKIDFNNLNKYKKQEVKHHISKKVDTEENKDNCFRNLFTIVKYLCKQIFRFEKIILSLFIIVFSLVLLLIFSCSDYEKKVINQLINKNNLKSIELLCSLESKDYCKNVFSNYDIDEVVYNYIKNLPDDSKNDFETRILVFPNNKNNLDNVDQKLLYGRYFKNKNEVVLGFNLANEIAKEKNSSLSDLIGKKIKLKLPDIEDEFEIVGIIKCDALDDSFYRATLGNYDFNNYYFLNSNYVEKYLYDDIYGGDETNTQYQATTFNLYFNNVNEFIKFYNNYKDKDFSNSLIRINDPVDNFANYRNNDELIQELCFVTSVSFLILGFVFYYQIHKIRIAYTEHNYSIYEYYGYNEKSVKIATSIYFIIYIVIIILISCLISTLFSKVLNVFIINKGILPYPLFIASVDWEVKLLIISIIVALIESFLINNSRKKKGWFYLIKEKSDTL